MTDDDDILETLMADDDDDGDDDVPYEDAVVPAHPVGEEPDDSLLDDETITTADNIPEAMFPGEPVTDPEPQPEKKGPPVAIIATASILAIAAIGGGIWYAISGDDGPVIVDHGNGGEEQGDGESGDPDGTDVSQGENPDSLESLAAISLKDMTKEQKSRFIDLAQDEIEDEEVFKTLVEWFWDNESEIENQSDEDREQLFIARDLLPFHGFDMPKREVAPKLESRRRSFSPVAPPPEHHISLAEHRVHKDAAARVYIPAVFMTSGQSTQQTLTIEDLNERLEKARIWYAKQQFARELVQRHLSNGDLDKAIEICDRILLELEEAILAKKDDKEKVQKIRASSHEFVVQRSDLVARLGRHEIDRNWQAEKGAYDMLKELVAPAAVSALRVAKFKRIHDMVTTTVEHLNNTVSSTFIESSTELEELERLKNDIHACKTGLAELNWRIKVQADLDGIGLPVPFAKFQDSTAAAASVDAIQLPPSKASNEEIDQLAVVKDSLKRWRKTIEDTLTTDEPLITSPDGIRLVELAVQNVRSSWREIKIMQQMVANRPDPVTVADMKARLEPLELYDGQSIEKLKNDAPQGAQPQEKYLELVDQLDGHRTAFLKALASPADPNDPNNTITLKDTDPVPSAVFKEATKHLENIRKTYYLLKAVGAISDATGPPPAGLTPAGVKRMLASLAIPTDADLDMVVLPIRATADQKTNLNKARKLVKDTRTDVLGLIADKPADEELSETDAANVTLNFEKLRRAYIQFGTLGLIPPPPPRNVGGTTYVYAESPTAGTVLSALKLIGLPADLNSLRPENANAAELAEFNTARDALGALVQKVLDAVEGKEDSEKLEEAAFLDVSNKLNSVRVSYAELWTKHLLSKGGGGGGGNDTPPAFTPRRIRAILAGLGNLSNITLPDSASDALKTKYAAEKTQTQAAVARITELIAGISDDALIGKDPIEQNNQNEPATRLEAVAWNIEEARRGFAMLRLYVELAKLPKGDGDTIINITTITTPEEVRAALSGLGLPDILGGLTLPSDAPVEQQREFQSIREGVQGAMGRIDSALADRVAEDVIPHATLVAVTKDLGAVRYGLANLGAHVIVARYGGGGGGENQPLLTRARIGDFLSALELPTRLDALQPGSQRPAAVTEQQFTHHQTTWTSLSNDTQSLETMANGTGALTAAEVAAARTLMDKVTVNLLKLETALQIAQLKFPEKPESQGQMASASVPMWITNECGILEYVGRVRTSATGSATASASSGVSKDDVAEIVTKESQKLRDELQQRIDEALVKPRALAPEQLDTVTEATADRVMEIISGNELPPFTLPPDPGDAQANEAADRTEARRQWERGSYLFSSSRPDANDEAMRHFSAASRLSPRDATYRYYLALALKRYGNELEAARQARIGASLETDRDRRYINTELQSVQGKPRLWLERLRKSI